MSDTARPFIVTRRRRSFVMACKTPLRVLASTRNAHKVLAIYVSVYCADDEGRVTPLQIADTTEIAESTVRKHLRQLQRLDFVREWTDGTWGMYGDMDDDQHSGLKGLVEGL